MLFWTGYDVYDDCGVERYSMYSALDAMDYYFPDQLTTCAGNSSQYYLGKLFIMLSIGTPIFSVCIYKDQSITHLNGNFADIIITSMRPCV